MDDVNEVVDKHLKGDDREVMRLGKRLGSLIIQSKSVEEMGSYGGLMGLLTSYGDKSLIVKVVRREIGRIHK
ncbi:MAG: hypothetical protein PF442_11655 [Desulfobulbaceae bacterium]|jgi:hypothetical protein|nr:hypothetical protein [Desulfobulbaceae bacterium]